MRATKDTAPKAPIAVDADGLQEILSCGYATAVKIGTDAGARIKIGRRVIWNVKKIQEYLDRVSE